MFTRISLSDLIIYNVLCNYEKTPKYRKDFEKKEIVDKFLSVVKQKQTSIDDISHLIRELLPKAKGLQNMPFLLKRKNPHPDYADKTALILRQIVGLSEEIKNDFKNTNSEEYRNLMQDFGDNIRRCGNPFNYTGKYRKDKHERWCRDIEAIINFLYFHKRYSFFILDSFRNPYEALYFAKKYTDFYLIAINASEGSRRKRLERLGFNLNEENEERDQGKKVKNEKIYFKQHVPRTVKLSDISISNNSDLGKNNSIKEKLIKKVVRYLALIFDAGCTKPNDDEVMMNLAYTMAMKSNCISLQVGAVIVGRDGYIVGAGWNDVGEGQISCGLREIKDLESGVYDEHVRVLLNKDDEYTVSDADRKKVIDMLIKDYIDEKIHADEIIKFCFCFKDEFSNI
jgi:deoxycytidylate deaminase